MTLSIVILSYNTPQLIKKCIDSLILQFDQEIKNEKIEIIIVDNASSEKNLKEVENFTNSHKKIKLIKSLENLGFGKGCNLGAESSKGDYVLFLNSDTETKDKGYLKMADFLKEHNDVVILGGKLTNSDGSPQVSVGKFYTLLNFFIMIFGGERFGLLKSSPDKICKVDWVAGASLMVNKKLFNEIEGFDRNIFMYVEDMELSFRAKKKGYKTYFFPDVSTIHLEQGSSNKGFAIINIYKGVLYFYKKHQGGLSYQIVRLTLFIKAGMVYLFGKISNNSYYTNTYGQALKLLKN